MSKSKYASPLSVPSGDGGFAIKGAAQIIANSPDMPKEFNGPSTTSRDPSHHDKTDQSAISASPQTLLEQRPEPRTPTRLSKVFLRDRSPREASQLLAHTKDPPQSSDDFRDDRHSLRSQTAPEYDTLDGCNERSPHWSPTSYNQCHAVRRSLSPSRKRRRLSPSFPCNLPLSPAEGQHDRNVRDPPSPQRALNMLVKATNRNLSTSDNLIAPQNSIDPHRCDSLPRQAGLVGPPSRGSIFKSAHEQQRQGMDVSNLKNVPTGPRNSVGSHPARSSPHAFISRDALPESGHSENLYGYMRRFSPLSVHSDDDGYYIVFPDDPAGQYNLENCARTRRLKRFCGLYVLQPEAYPRGQPLVQNVNTESGGCKSIESSTLATPLRSNGTNMMESASRAVTQPAKSLSTSHASPLDMDESSSIISGRTATSSDISASRKSCHICKTVSSLEIQPLVVCSTCPRRYHRRCHSPPIPELTVGEWKCRRCLRKQPPSAGLPTMLLKRCAASTEPRRLVNGSAAGTASCPAQTNTGLKEPATQERQADQTDGSFRPALATSTKNRSYDRKFEMDPIILWGSPGASDVRASIPASGLAKNPNKPIRLLPTEDTTYDEATDLVERSFAAERSPGNSHASIEKKPKTLKLTRRKIKPDSSSVQQKIRDKPRNDTPSDNEDEISRKATPRVVGNDSTAVMSNLDVSPSRTTPQPAPAAATLGDGRATVQSPVTPRERPNRPPVPEAAVHGHQKSNVTMSMPRLTAKRGSKDHCVICSVCGKRLTSKVPTRIIVCNKCKEAQRDKSMREPTSASGDLHSLAESHKQMTNADLNGKHTSSSANAQLKDLARDCSPTKADGSDHMQTSSNLGIKVRTKKSSLDVSEDLSRGVEDLDFWSTPTGGQLVLHPPSNPISAPNGAKHALLQAGSSSPVKSGICRESLGNGNALVAGDRVDIIAAERQTPRCRDGEKARHQGPKPDNDAQAHSSISDTELSDPPDDMSEADGDGLGRESASNVRMTAENRGSGSNLSDVPDTAPATRDKWEDASGRAASTPSTIKMIGMALCDAQQLQRSSVCSWIAENIPGFELGGFKLSSRVSFALSTNNIGRGGHLFSARPWEEGDDDTHGKGYWWSLAPGVRATHERWDPVLKTPVSPPSLVSKPKSRRSIVVDGRSPKSSRLDGSQAASAMRVRQGVVNKVPRHSHVVTTSRKPEQALLLEDGESDTDSSDDEPLASKRSVPPRQSSAANAAAQMSNGKHSTIAECGPVVSASGPQPSTSGPDAAVQQNGLQPRSKLILKLVSRPDDPMDVDCEKTRIDSVIENSALPKQEIATSRPKTKNLGLQITAEQAKGMSIEEMLKADSEMVQWTTRPLYEEWPEYDPANQTDCQAKMEEIRKRPTRKQMFGKPACYSRLPGHITTNSTPAALEPDDEALVQEPDWPPRDENTKYFDTLEDFFGLPSNPIPIIHQGELAYRDGTTDEQGRLPRAKAIYRCGAF